MKPDDIKYTPPTIGNPQIQLLEQLSNACAISGDEQAVRKLIIEKLKGFGEDIVDDIQVDALGNVLVRKAGRSSNPRIKVMVTAHMDEVGFMIVKDDGKGIYQFEIVGGIHPSNLPGKAVMVGKEKIPGVIGAKPIHLTTPSERQNEIKKDSLRIDVGPTTNNSIKPGDRATFAPNFTQLGSGNGRSIQSKALDDRIGVATLIEIVKNPPPNIDLFAAFTVQEEIGLRGAKVAAHAFDPDIGIALDCTPAYDLPHYDPDEENFRYNTRLGEGPAIYISDAGTLADPRLVRHLTETGDELGIPYQFRQPGGGSTDAAAIHKSRAGIPSVSISVPGRYLHTAASLIRISDWRNSLKLVTLTLSRLENNLLATDRR